MIALRQILCPTDFSEGSSRALEQAAALARCHHARIDVLHVHPLAAIPPPEMPYLPGTNPLTAREREVALANLRRLVEPVRLTGARAQVSVAEGNPAVEIVARAEASDADLVVMGTHGRGWLERFVLGSVAEKVLRTSPCPVLTVSPRAEKIPHGTFRRILCPLDLLDTSPITARHAFALAQESGAEVLMLHVLDGRFPPSPLPFHLDFDGDRKEVEGFARSDLQELVPADAAGRRPPELLVRWARSPQRAILTLAEARDVDLIVMGAWGSALQQAMFGSTAQEVVRGAPCPVMTVRPAARQNDEQPELAGATAGGEPNRSAT